MLFPEIGFIGATVEGLERAAQNDDGPSEHEQDLLERLRGVRDAQRGDLAGPAGVDRDRRATWMAQGSTLQVAGCATSAANISTDARLAEVFRPAASS